MTNPPAARTIVPPRNETLEFERALRELGEHDARLENLQKVYKR